MGAVDGQRACRRSRSRLVHDDGQIGTSVCRADALRDVESRDRTAETPQFQIFEVFEPRNRADRFSNAAADQDLPVLRLGARLHTVPMAV